MIIPKNRNILLLQTRMSTLSIYSFNPSLLIAVQKMHNYIILLDITNSDSEPN